MRLTQSDAWSALVAYTCVTYASLAWNIVVVAYADVSDSDTATLRENLLSLNATLTLNRPSTVAQLLKYEEDIVLLRKILESKVSLFVLVNLGIHTFIVTSIITKAIFLGTLHDLEVRKTMERMLNYVTFKVVFVGAVVEPDVMEVLLWMSWFTLLGFFKMFTGLVQDRCEWLTSAPGATRVMHLRAAALLVMLLGAVCVCSAVSGGALHRRVGLSDLLLLQFELVLMGVDLVRSAVKYAVHVADLDSPDSMAGGAGLESEWRGMPAGGAGLESEWRGTFLVHAEFVGEALALTLTLLHYLHI
ncbi:hypothetical protein CYMTET_35461, partial [Cymbomonas tetramitiformis]